MIKKYFLIVLVLLFFSDLKAQGDNQTWQFGANFMPFMFWKKNSYLDNQPMPHLQVQPTNTINGISGGIFIEKYWNKNIGVKIEINYSNQNFNTKSTTVAKDNNGNWDFSNIYLMDISKNRFNYFLIPITFNYARTLNKEKNFFWISGIGPQISIISQFDNHKYYVGEDGRELGAWFITGIKSFRPVLLGGTAFSGVKFKISEAFKGFVNAKFDYDFSNASKGKISSEIDNPMEYGALEITDPTLPYSAVNASKSHNMRLGIEFGVVYDFR